MFLLEDEISSLNLESYNFLRTNLEHLSRDKNLKTILITSSDIEDGKTTIVKNLSLSLAKGRKRVILVDCNLRKPSINEYFHVDNNLGITEIITEKISIEDSVKKILENLYIITSGKIPISPSELIGSKEMEDLIENLKENYDYVILDASPVLIFPDSQILSTKVDGTILVVRSEKTKKENVIKAKDILDKVNANIIGIVLNGIKNKKEKGYDYYKEDRKKLRKIKKYRNKKIFSLDLT